MDENEYRDMKRHLLQVFTCSTQGDRMMRDFANVILSIIETALQLFATHASQVSYVSRVAELAMQKEIYECMSKPPGAVDVDTTQAVKGKNG